MTKQILIKPVISEKTEQLSAKKNQYAFIVDKKANKIEIKKAVESTYGTNVLDVNTTIMPAKLKSRNSRSGVLKGRVSAFKKAYVTLAEGEELDIYGSNDQE
jgi:large subunit ribosomal protein L23